MFPALSPAIPGDTTGDDCDTTASVRCCPRGQSAGIALQRGLGVSQEKVCRDIDGGDLLPETLIPGVSELVSRTAWALGVRSLSDRREEIGAGGLALRPVGRLPTGITVSG